MAYNEKKIKIVLIICNIVLITIMIVATGFYSVNIRKNQEKVKTESFIRTIESMKQVSQNYLDSEKGYVNNWANYITNQNMTMEEALDFLRTINTDSKRFAHIVDIDTFEAYSTFYPKGEEAITTYKWYSENESINITNFSKTLYSIFNDSQQEFQILGRYRLKETQSTAISVGKRITIRTNTGNKDYLLLRIIPTEELKNTWVFPVEYASAEVGIIKKNGEYVIQSDSMKSSSLLEYIRAYNFQDDYSKVLSLANLLEKSDHGTMNYKNYRDTECVWYYSTLEEGSSLDIVGMVDISELKSTLDAWSIVFLVCGTMLVLVLVDGFYLISINAKLREAVRTSQEASQAKTQFLSAMSHDIRTPLNAVLGMMRIAKKKSNDASAVEEYMNKGLGSGKQLLTLINDVLDISKIESGNVTLNDDRIDLKQLIQDLIEMVSASVKEKNLQLIVDCDQLAHRIVLADMMRLNQVFINILTNAVKYTEVNGKIIIHLSQEEVIDKQGYTKLIYCVEDNGIGMSEEFQKSMYNTFSREVNTQVNRTQGTGLGLSIVKQVVDLMGGKIDCVSAPFKGTKITVTLEVPVVDDDMDNELDEEINVDIHSMHLLIAEDNDLNWEIAHELLLDKGITTTRAENGQRCIELLQEAPLNTYSAILMDVHMPIKNGYEATKIIRSLDDERSHIPIIAMTADAFAEDIQACIHCGMNGHIAKPVNIDKLLSVLLRIINKANEEEMK